MFFYGFNLFRVMEEGYGLEFRIKKVDVFLRFQFVYGFSLFGVMEEGYGLRV